jgi:hypothetical protein
MIVQKDHLTIQRKDAKGAKWVVINHRGAETRRFFSRETRNKTQSCYLFLKSNDLLLSRILRCLRPVFIKAFAKILP